MKRAMFVIPGLFLGLNAFAAPAPAVIHVQGVLREDSGLLMSGNFNMTFSLYDAPTGGNVVFADTLAGVASDGGVFSALLGQNGANPLDPAIFQNYTDLYLGLTVEGTELPGRVRLASVPYALQAEHANACEMAELAVDATQLGGRSALDYQLRVTGTCPAGQSMVAVGADGSVTCEPDDDTTYATASPLVLTGTTIGLMSCAEGQVLKYLGGAWTCASDDSGAGGAGDITGVFTAGGSGLVGGGSAGDVSLSLLSCASGQTLEYGASGWQCGIDDDTLYDASWPIALSGSTIRLDGGMCLQGDVLKWDMGSGAWQCAPDQDTNTTYTAGAGLLLTGNQFSADFGTGSGQVAAGNHLHDARYLQLTGGAMTGPLSLPANGLVAGTNQLVLSGGKVGIGTATPGANVEIVAAADVSGNVPNAFTVRTSGSGFPQTLLMMQEMSWVGSVGITDSVVIRRSNCGNTGCTFDLVANPAVIRAINGPGTSLRPLQVRGQRLDFYTSTSTTPGSETVRMTLDEDGDLGIGTSTPASKLTVAGTIESTSGGFRFPDGSLQSSAAASYNAGPGLTLASTTFSANFTASGGDNGTATTVARGDHLHDGRYYTESELNTPGTINLSTNPVDWTRLKGVPGSLADGVDDNTTYSAGSGLSLSGTTFSVAAGGITQSMLANSSVDSTKILDGSVGTSDIASGALTFSHWSQNGCTVNRVPKWDGTSWTCGTDENTTYTAGTGLSLVSTTFSVDFTASGGDNGTATTVARGDHVHDGRYFTQSTLQTAGTINTSTNPVDWTKLKGVPTGFADGTDNDTTYVAGSGLLLVGSTFSIDLSGFPFTYVRWGTTTCPYGSLLYSGSVGTVGTSAAKAGLLCIDTATSPTSVQSDLRMIRKDGSTNGGRINGSGGAVPCAVCTGATFVRWGTQTCPSGFSSVYVGFAGYLDEQDAKHDSEPVCLDSTVGTTWPNPADTHHVWAINNPMTPSSADPLALPCVVCRR